MGISLAWIAVQGVDPDEALERLGFLDTGESDDMFDAEHSAGEIEGGWFVVVTEAIDLLDTSKLPEWSAGGRLVAAVVIEDALTSLATEWRDGKQVWSVFHDGSAEASALEVDGALPAEFEELRREIEASGEGDEGIALAFDVAIELAEAVTGFSHDALGFDESMPTFTRLERD